MSEPHSWPQGQLPYAPQRYGYRVHPLPPARPRWLLVLGMAPVLAGPVGIVTAAVGLACPAAARSVAATAAVALLVTLVLAITTTIIARHSGSHGPVGAPGGGAPGGCRPPSEDETSFAPPSPLLSSLRVHLDRWNPAGGLDQ